MTLSQMINELERINHNPMDYAAAKATQHINNVWATYANVELGETRQKVENLIDRAWSKMRLAGFRP